MVRQRDYLFQRGAVWWIKFQYPSGEPRRIERSLRTKIHREAMIAAAPLIAEHNARVWEADNRRNLRARVTDTGYRFPLGESTLEDGTRVFATPEKALFLKDGALVKELENERCITGYTFRFDPRDQPERPKKHAPKATTGDDGFIETWIVQRNVGDYLQKEARTTWELFKQLTNNKPLVECDRDDGRKLVKHLFDSGNKSATVQKKISHLCSAVNIAMDDRKLLFNPFSKIMPKVKDKTERLAFSEEDMAVMANHAHVLDREHHLLFQILARTGMRLSEAFQITEEERKGGIRYAKIGQKSDQSERYVPFLDALIPLLPERVDGCLFTDSPKNMGRNLLRWMRGKCKIVDPRKVNHCFRHRAKDRLADAGCPEDIRDECFGWNELTASDGYGSSRPIRLIKEWMEKIGA